MLDVHYQAFIMTSGPHAQQMRALLIQTLIGLNCFAWAVEQRTPLASLLARRQIDQTDYVLVILDSLDEDEADLEALQLEYAYARAKRKPILALLSDQMLGNHDRLRVLIEQDSHQVLVYQQMNDLIQQLRRVLPQFVRRYPAQGWVRTQSQKPPKYRQSQQSVAIDSAAPPAQMLSLDKHVPQVQLSDFYAFEYRAHVYYGQQFKEMYLARRMTWAELFAEIGPAFSPCASEDQFATIMSNYLNRTALADAQRLIPDAYSVSRCQMNASALYRLKLLFKANQWLMPTVSDSRQHSLWALTPIGESILESILFNQKDVVAL